MLTLYKWTIRNGWVQGILYEEDGYVEHGGYIQDIMKDADDVVIVKTASQKFVLLQKNRL